MTRRILVIEDDSKHRSDAERFFESISDLEVHYAKHYGEVRQARTGISNRTHERIHEPLRFDGVISDIYFPFTRKRRREPEPEALPIGVKVAVELSEEEIPFVLNTAGYHHGARYEWVNEMSIQQGWDLIDASQSDTEADSKNWAEAYKCLEDKMNEVNLNP